MVELERKPTQQSGETKKPEEKIKPLSPLNRFFLFAYAMGGQLRNPFDYMLTPKGNARLIKLTGIIAKGEPGLTSLAEERNLLLPNYQTIATGMEHIPEKGPVVIATNHYNKGPEKGEWETFAIARFLADIFPQDTRRFRVIVQKDKNLWKPLCSLPYFGKKLDNFYKRAVDDVYSHAARVFDFVEMDKSRRANGLRLNKVFKEENAIICVFPTEAEYKLSQGKEEAGALFKIAGKRGWLILPVAAYHIKEHNIFIIHVGKPINPDDASSNQEAASLVMEQIAELAPTQMKRVRKQTQPWRSGD